MQPSASPDAEHLIVGTVQKPHGIRGELSVRLETDHPDEVFRPGRVLRLSDAAGRPAGGVLTVVRVRPFKGGVLLQSAEHTGRTPELEALRGRSLVIPREDAPPLDEGEVFIHQLPGLRVEADGVTVGTVREVFEAPAGHLLEVRCPDGREVLIPFVPEVIARVDVAQGVVEIRPPPGLLEL